jgi:hypothetical protein
MVTMKIIIIGIVLLVTAFNLVIFAPAFTTLFASYTKIIYLNWGINLP